MDIDPLNLIWASLILALGFWGRRLFTLNQKLRLEKSKLLSQKKSSEVITGQIAEKLAPFLSDFEYDPQNAIFLGQPIDYLVFDEDEIVFVEIKSGKARLTTKQRKIRDNKI